MTFTFPQKCIFLLTIVYLIIFGQYFVRNFNVEFIAYAGLIVGIMLLLYGTLHITKFPTYIVAGLSVWGLLHMMGGSVMTSDGVLYAWKIYPFFDGGGDFYILKFDQVVHAGLYGVVALMFVHLFREMCGLKNYQGFIAVAAIMAALGVSAINEIIEFGAVLTVPDNGVGGYENTLLDIIFNFGGAIIATIGFYLLQNNKKSTENVNS